MNAISMGLASATPIMLSVQTSVVLTSLANGIARPGETLGVGLSNGISITTYAWDNTPRGAEYGTGPNEIQVQTLSTTPVLPALTLSADADAIIVESA